VPDTVIGNTVVPVTSSRLPHFVPGIVAHRKDTYFTAGFGKPVIDTYAGRFAHRIYVPTMGCAKETLFQDGRRDFTRPFGQCPSAASAYMFYSDDGGLRWHSSFIARGRTAQIRFWPVSPGSVS